MTKTMMPGDGGDSGERADVFGTEEFLAPFELPQLNPLALHRSFHN